MSQGMEESTSINLRSGRTWSSFEQLRTEGASSLEPIKNGTIATLHTKTGQYRILEEHDFQNLLGLATDVARLRKGLRLVLQSVRVVQKHRDEDSLNMLVEAVTMVGSLPGLPTHEGFEELISEDSDIEPEDEVELDPERIERPFAASSASKSE